MRSGTGRATGRDGAVTAPGLVVLLAVGATALLVRRRARSRVDAEVWPWLIDEVEVAIAGGRPPAVALLGVALHGPPPLRTATRPAVDAWRASGDPSAGIRTLQHTMADPRLDRICRAVEAVVALDGDAAVALARLRTTAVADAGHDRQRRRSLRSMLLSAWVASVPLAAASVGVLDGSAAVIAVTVSAGAWGVWLVARSLPATRVFVEHP